MKEDKRNDYIKYRLEKAEETLEAAELLINNRHYEHQLLQV